MFVNKLIYFVVVIISVLFYILYTGTLSLYILIFMISLPVLLAMCVLSAKLLIKGTPEAVPKTSVKNGKITVSVSIRNKTPIPFSNSIITIEYFNTLINVKDTMTISIPIHPFCREKVNFVIISDYCGIMNIRIKSIQVYDFIKLFSSKIKPNRVCSVAVLPEIYPPDSLIKPDVVSSEESDVFSKHKSGDDPSEIFALKDYIPGDRPNRIHWKLSFKQNELIVKHYSQPVSSSVLLALDFCGKPSLEFIGMLDTAAETAFSLSFFLIENEVPFEFAFFSGRSGNIRTASVNSSVGIAPDLINIFMEGPCESTVFPETLPEISLNYSKIIYVTSSAENLSRLYCSKIYDNLTVIFIKSGDQDMSYDFEKSGQITVIPSGGFRENASDILI